MIQWNPRCDACCALSSALLSRDSSRAFPLDATDTVLQAQGPRQKGLNLHHRRGRGLEIMYFLYGTQQKYSGQDPKTVLCVSCSKIHMSHSVLAAWCLLGMTRDKPLDHGCPQTHLMRKPFSKDETPTGFGVWVCILLGLAWLQFLAKPLVTWVTVYLMHLGEDVNNSHIA